MIPANATVLQNAVGMAVKYWARKVKKPMIKAGVRALVKSSKSLVGSKCHNLTANKTMVKAATPFPMIAAVATPVIPNVWIQVTEKTKPTVIPKIRPSKSGRQ